MMLETSSMVGEADTTCSVRQEHLVSPWRRVEFQPRDIVDSRAKTAGMREYMGNEERRKAAYRRFSELMADLAYPQDDVPGFVIDALGAPPDLSKKAISQWYQREEIPIYAVFNLADALGIDAGWLGGSNRIPKAKAILKDGLYAREIRRFERLKPPRATRRTG